MEMVDLKMSKDDMEEETTPQSLQNPYPYGLCLRLDGDELDKLGITVLPSVGDEFHIEAVGSVTSVAEMNRQNSESRHVEIQIKMLGLENEGAEANGETAAEEASEAEAGEVEGASTVMRSTYRGR